MNYWILTTEFPPLFGGGISTYCWHTAKMFSENGAQIKVFVPDFSIEDKRVETPFPNCQLIRFRPEKVQHASCLGYEARLSLEFSNILEEYIKEEGKPDFIEAQDYMGIGYYTMLKKQLLYPAFKDIPIVLTIHAPGFLYLEYNQVPQYKFPEFWYGEMEKGSIRMADILISPSNYIVDELKPRMDLKGTHPIKIFNPFVPLDIPETTLTKFDIAFFGKLTPQKGCIEMFKYFAEMWDEGFPHPIRVIGGGQHFFYPQQEDMIDFLKRKYTKYFNEGKIIFEGNLHPDKLKDRLAKAHVIITPSIVDNLPYAVLEAMSIGKIVLSSSNGGHTEILQNSKSGFVFSHQKEGDFKNKLNHILSLSPSQIQTIGQQAIEDVIKHTNYDTVYQQKIERLKSHKRIEKNTFTFTREIKNTLSDDTVGIEGKLSIVIPFYNLGDFIEETVVSAVNSNYTNKEIIVVNDGSKNKSDLEVLKKIESKYPVKVIHKNNSGLSETRNYGAKIATGQYLAFLDADDTIHPNFYSKSIQVLQQYENVHFVGCWAQYFDASQDIWPTFTPEPPYLCVHNMINSSALIYKKDSFLKFGLNDKKLIYGMEDYDSVIAMVKNGARGVSIPELYWNYRIRPDSMQQSFTKNKELYLYKIIGDKHKKFFGKYANEVAHLLNQNGPGITYDNPTWNINNGVRLPEFNGRLMQIVKRVPILRKIGKKVYHKLLG